MNVFLYILNLSIWFWWWLHCNTAKRRKKKLSNWGKNELLEQCFLMVTIIYFKQLRDLRRERDLGRITGIRSFWRYHRTCGSAKTPHSKWQKTKSRWDKTSRPSCQRVVFNVKAQSEVVQDPSSLVSFEVIRNRVKAKHITVSTVFFSLSDSYQGPLSIFCDLPPIFSLMWEAVYCTVSLRWFLTQSWGSVFEVADEIKEKPYWNPTFTRKPWPGSACTKMWGLLRLCSTVWFWFCRIGTWLCLLAKCKRRRGKRLTLGT